MTASIVLSNCIIDFSDFLNILLNFENYRFQQIIITYQHNRNLCINVFTSTTSTPRLNRRIMARPAVNSGDVVSQLTILGRNPYIL